MESVLPKIKKKISSYINSETGRITKQSIITIGAFIGTAALATLATTKTAKAGLTAELNPTEGEKINVTGKHVSHASHQVSCNEACGQSCGENCNPICEQCETGCEVSCEPPCQTLECGQGCGSGECGNCEKGCQDCQTACELSCQHCQSSSELCREIPHCKNVTG